MPNTLLFLVNDALGLLQVLPPGATIGLDGQALGLRAVNRLLKSLNAEKLLIPGLSYVDCDLTGAASYTIGYGPPAVVGTVDGSGSFTIAAGSCKVKLSIDGEAAVTVTLTTGTRTLADVVGETNAILVAAGGNTALALASISSGMYVKILGGTFGPSAAVQVIAISDDAYTVLGFTAGTTTSGSDFPGDRPIKIVAAVTVLANGSVFPVNIKTAAQWATIPDRTRTGLIVEDVFYDAGFPVGTLKVTPKPTGGKLELTTYQPVAAFTSMSDIVDLAPGYERALTALLAVELAPSWYKEVGPTLTGLAAQAKTTIQRLQVEVLGMEPPVLGMSARDEAAAAYTPSAAPAGSRLQ
jgi:hypothetical protein